jgi:hypothetical protein
LAAFIILLDQIMSLGLDIGWIIGSNVFRLFENFCIINVKYCFLKATLLQTAIYTHAAFSFPGLKANDKVVSSFQVGTEQIIYFHLPWRHSNSHSTLWNSHLTRKNSAALVYTGSQNIFPTVYKLIRSWTHTVVGFVMLLWRNMTLTWRGSSVYFFIRSLSLPASIKPLAASESFIWLHDRKVLLQDNIFRLLLFICFSFSHLATNVN